jgi:hypothetical protein
VAADAGAITTTPPENAGAGVGANSYYALTNLKRRSHLLGLPF